ncbi:MAG: HD-GYP domain-containing protein [Burkholderiaceae bacterium]|nr:HD-GYP domain-containing protein [Burkholderiaceae bacterium]
MWLLELFKKSGAAPTVVESPSTAHTDRDALLASLLAMAWVVEARDPYTGGHLWRVSRYAALLCESAGVPDDQCARIAIGGFLHDLGKVGVPDAILRKPGRLDDAEYAVIKTHPKVGARLLAGHPLAAMARDAVLLHHETPDGRGYPQGLAGADIPLAARVVGLCDAFDAMTSTRPYRAGMPLAQALAIIEAGLGSQFDDALGHHFLALGRRGLLDHVAGHSDDGIPLQHCMACGPSLVVRREQVEGDTVFCRNCGGGYRLASGHDDRLLQAVPTGRMGSASDLEPVADTALIERFVQGTAHGVWVGAPQSLG